MIESPFQKAYEFEERYGIDRLRLCIEKAEKAYQTYEPETIGYCKNILESICKSVLEEKNETYSDKENVQNLVGKTLGLFNINSQISGGLTNIIGGCSQIAKGVGEIRNDKCITGHGATNKKLLPTKPDIDICVSTVLHIIDIIYTVIINEKIDIASTKLKFEKVDEIPEYNFRNKYIDNYACVNYDPEAGLIFINGKEVRPSEILYNLDRLSYNELQSAKLVDIMEFGDKQYLEEIILESFIDNPFDDMIDNPNIEVNSYSASIYDIEFEDNYLCACGTLRWDEIGDGGTSYCSADFKASFTYEYDETIAGFSFNIENLEF